MIIFQVIFQPFYIMSCHVISCHVITSSKFVQFFVKWKFEINQQRWFPSSAPRPKSRLKVNPRIRRTAGRQGWHGYLSHPHTVWGVQRCRRRPQTAHPWNGRKAVSGVAHLQGVEGSGMAGPGETLGSPWPPLALHPCSLGDAISLFFL